MKSYKIDVSASHELSEKVQKHAIKLGYKKYHHEQYDAYKFIFLYSDGTMMVNNNRRFLTQLEMQQIPAADFLKLNEEDVI